LQEARSRVNRLKLTEHWREIMRRIKATELRKELDVLAQNLERTVDRKEALLQLLERDVDEADEQYQMALRSHLQNIDSLVELQAARLRAMDGQARSEITDLIAEFDEERARIQAAHARTMEELNQIVATMENDFNEQQAAAKQDFHSAKDEIKGKASEEYNILSIVLDSQIEQLGSQFEQLHARYLMETDTKTKSFKALTASDKEHAKTIKKQQRKLERKHQELAHWKTKMTNNIRECTERNKALRAEKDAIARHFQDLKARMNAFRAAEARRLTDLTTNARAAIKKLGEQVELAEGVLRLSELNRKMESERERVQPFYKSSIDDAALWEDGEADEAVDLPTLAGLAGADQETLEAFQSSAVDDDGRPIPEWNYLANFYKRFNKVKLDQMAIKKEKERLLRENDSLRSMLKQFLDGISVNDGILATQNPLFIVNNKTSVPPASATVRPDEIPVIEGNKEVRNHRLRY
jgi:hypothetical protein